MQASTFIDEIEKVLGIHAYFGVPDSLLRAFCDEIVGRADSDLLMHVVAADEGGACGLAAGYYLATGSPACVYMQNSGIGNAVNPICSLLDRRVYALPVLFVVGWRGEPGIHDEPQHVFQGECSEDLLKCVGLSVHVVGPDMSIENFHKMLQCAKAQMDRGVSAALLVRKGAVLRDVKRDYGRGLGMSRESAVEAVVANLPDSAAVVSTTGKLSRELFEIRERRGEGHESDFLTVGSMGHASMIGLGVALGQPDRLVVVLDGDGAALMHTGALAIVGSTSPANYVHVLVNNFAHESVGGMPTASPSIDWCAAAKAMGYESVCTAANAAEVSAAITRAFYEPDVRPAFIEVRACADSRSDLGRPTTSARGNGLAFLDFLCSDNENRKV